MSLELFSKMGQIAVCFEMIQDEGKTDGTDGRGENCRGLVHKCKDVRKEQLFVCAAGRRVQWIQHQ